MLALRDLQPPPTPPALVVEPFEAWCEAASQSPEAALAAVAGRLRFSPYAGRVWGAEGAWRSARANSVDAAELLARCLSRGGHRFRLVRARLDQAAAAGLLGRARPLPQTRPPIAPAIDALAEHLETRGPALGAALLAAQGRLRDAWLDASAGDGGAIDDAARDELDRHLLGASEALASSELAEAIAPALPAAWVAAVEAARRGAGAAIDDARARLRAPDEATTDVLKDRITAAWRALGELRPCALLARLRRDDLAAVNADPPGQPALAGLQRALLARAAARAEAHAALLGPLLGDHGEGDEAALVDAAADHVWVQVLEGDAWVDLDPLAPQPAPGRRLAPPDAILGEALPEALGWRLRTRVELESRVKEGAGFRLETRILLDLEVPTAELDTLELGFSPAQATEGILGQALIGALTGVERRRWLPWVRHGERVVGGDALELGLTTDEDGRLVVGDEFGAGDRVATRITWVFDYLGPDGAERRAARTILDRYPAGRRTQPDFSAAIPGEPAPTRGGVPEAFAEPWRAVFSGTPAHVDRLGEGLAAALEALRVAAEAGADAALGGALLGRGARGDRQEQALVGAALLRRQGAAERAALRAASDDLDLTLETWSEGEGVALIRALPAIRCFQRGRVDLRDDPLRALGPRGAGLRVAALRSALEARLLQPTCPAGAGASSAFDRLDDARRRGWTLIELRVGEPALAGADGAILDRLAEGCRIFAFRGPEGELGDAWWELAADGAGLYAADARGHAAMIIASLMGTAIGWIVVPVVVSAFVGCVVAAGLTVAATALDQLDHFEEVLATPGSDPYHELLKASYHAWNYGWPPAWLDPATWWGGTICMPGWVALTGW